MKSRGEVYSTARTHLAGQKANDCETGPLPETEGLDELTLGVTKRKSDRVDRGNWQGSL
jgi:hypothetical protein